MSGVDELKERIALARQQREQQQLSPHSKRLSEIANTISQATEKGDRIGASLLCHMASPQQSSPSHRYHEQLAEINQDLDQSTHKSDALNDSIPTPLRLQRSMDYSYVPHSVELASTELESVKKLAVLDNRIQAIMEKNKNLLRQRQLEGDRNRDHVLTPTSTLGSVGERTLSLSSSNTSTSHKDPISTVMEENARKIHEKMERILKMVEGEDVKAKEVRELMQVQTSLEEAETLEHTKITHERHETDKLHKTIVEASQALAIARVQLERDRGFLARATQDAEKFKRSFEIEQRAAEVAKRDVLDFTYHRNATPVKKPTKSSTNKSTSSSMNTSTMVVNVLGDVDVDFARLVDDARQRESFERSGILDNVNDSFNSLLKENGVTPDLSATTNHSLDLDEPAVAYVVVDDYDPIEDSPNNDPQHELMLKKGEVIMVMGTKADDGFFWAKKKGQGNNNNNNNNNHNNNNNNNNLVMGLVSSEYIAKVVDVAGDGDGNDEHVDGFVMVNDIPDHVVAENALDYVVVGLSAKERRDADRIMLKQKEQHGKAKAKVKAQANTSVRSNSAAKGKGKGTTTTTTTTNNTPLFLLTTSTAKPKLTSDPTIKPLLKQLKLSYEPMEISPYTETRAYGSRKPPFEKFIINGEVVSIWNKAGVVVVKSHNHWLPFAKFFKQFAILHDLTSLVAEEKQENYKTKIHQMEALVNSVKGDFYTTSETVRSSLKFEHAQEMLLKEQIAAAQDKIAAEREIEDEMMVELHGRNAQLVKAKKQMLSGDKSKGFLKTLKLHGTTDRPAKKLTIDEAITATILEVQNGSQFTDTEFMPSKSSISGNFRTYLINGNSVLLKIGSDGLMHVRDSHTWIDIWEYLVREQRNNETITAKQRELALKQAAKKRVNKEFELETKAANDKLKYVELADEYARNRVKLSNLSDEGQQRFNKKQVSVEALQAELQNLEDLQQAARARNQSLLQNMELRNKEILTDIESTHSKLLGETDVNFQGHQNLSDMQSKAEAAHAEYLRLKANIGKPPESPTRSSPMFMSSTPSPRAQSPPKQQHESKSKSKSKSSIPRKVLNTFSDLEQHNHNGKSAEDELDALFSQADSLMQSKS